MLYGNVDISVSFIFCSFECDLTHYVRWTNWKEYFSALTIIVWVRDFRQPTRNRFKLSPRMRSIKVFDQWHLLIKNLQYIHIIHSSYLWRCVRCFICHLAIRYWINKLNCWIQFHCVVAFFCFPLFVALKLLNFMADVFWISAPAMVSGYIIQNIWYANFFRWELRGMMTPYDTHRWHMRMCACNVFNTPKHLTDSPGFNTLLIL